MGLDELVDGGVDVELWYQEEPSSSYGTTPLSGSSSSGPPIPYGLTSVAQAIFLRSAEEYLTQRLALESVALRR